MRLALTGKRALELISTASFDIVLCASTIRDMSAPELCWRTQSLAADASFYCLTSSEDPTFADMVSVCFDNLLPLALLEEETEFAVTRVMYHLIKDRMRRDRTISQSIDGLVAAVDLKENGTSRHSLRVSQIAVEIGRAIGLDEKEADHLKRAALVHDVGKIGVPDHILQKPSPLSPEEWNVMKEHPVLGAQIVERIPGKASLRETVLHHHEWVNGSGYPHGLKGDRIPWKARILAVADAYEAMTSSRPFREGLPVSEARARLKRGAGSQFDPQAVSALLSIPEPRLAIAAPGAENPPDFREGAAIIRTHGP